MLTVGKGASLMSTVLVPFSASSVADARRAMADDVHGRVVDRMLIDDAMLVLSELLSNALKHARPLPSGRLRVRWSTTSNGVELEVTDGGSATRPRANPASMSATGGRGLGIVSSVARDWGVHEDSGRTTVWAVVAPRDRVAGVRAGERTAPLQGTDVLGPAVQPG